jgi:hypothetical protein
LRDPQHFLADVPGDHNIDSIWQESKVLATSSRYFQHLATRAASEVSSQGSETKDLR